MAEALREDGHRSVSGESHRNVQAVRAFFWIVGLILAGEQAWRHQYDVFSDGLSYLDVGDAYWRGDWTNAINSYWSPLYSWLTGLTVRLFSPSPAREGLLFHALGLGIFVLSLFAFDRFLTVLAEAQQRTQETEPADAPEAVPRLVFVALSYCVFLWSFLTLVGTRRINPDMLVAAFFLFASAIVLRACTAGLTARRAIALGLVLGLGYLAKAPMFLLAFVFLGVVLWRWRKDALARKRVLIAAGVYFAVAAPFAALLSHSKGRPTFGESGRLAYAWYATKLPHPPIEWRGQTPGAGVPVHPRLQLNDAPPPVYAFQGPLQSTYPGWLDPTYWYEGFRVKFDLKQQIRAIRLDAVEYSHLFLGIGRSDGTFMNPAVITGLALMFFASGRDWAIVQDVGKFWPALVPVLAALGMYLVVHVEARFLAAQITVLFGTLLAAVRVRRGAGWRRFVVGVALLAIVYWCGPFVYRLTKAAGITTPAPSRFDPTDSSGARWQLQVAEGLQGLGVRPGDKIGFIGRSWRFYWARLAGVRIVADLREGTGAEPQWFAPEARVFSPDVALFWASDLPARRNVMSAFRRAGALAVVCDSIPEGASREGWTNLGETPYYATLLSDSGWLVR